MILELKKISGLDELIGVPIILAQFNKNKQNQNKSTNYSLFMVCIAATLLM